MPMVATERKNNYCYHGNRTALFRIFQKKQNVNKIEFSLSIISCEQGAKWMMFVCICSIDTCIKHIKQIIVCSVMSMVSMEAKTLTYCVWFYLRLFRRILWLDNFLSWHATIPIRSLWCIYNSYKINIFVPTISVYIRPTSLK